MSKSASKTHKFTSLLPLHLLLLFISSLCLSAPLTSLENFSEDWEAIYQKIVKISSPSYKDIKSVQRYLTDTKREYLKWVATKLPGDHIDPLRYDLKLRGMRLLNSRSECDLTPRIFPCNSANNKDCCIICYASFNKNYGYPEKLNLRKQNYKQVNFSGDLIFQNGGWPNLSEGSLVLAHIPYAFKVCMFKEAKRLGYKKILWLDTSFEALRNFDSIFDTLDKEGIFLLSNAEKNEIRSIRDDSNSNLLEAYSITEKESEQIPQLAAGIIGINLETGIGNMFLDIWYEATKNIHNSLSSRPEQNLISFLAFEQRIPPTASLMEYCAIYRKEIKPHHYFFIAY